MATELHSLYDKQIQRINEVTVIFLFRVTRNQKTIQFFEKLIAEAFPSDAPASDNFAVTMETVVNNTLEFFEQRAKGNKIFFSS
jgi:uncharacterized protein (DUF4213/DUF364 family)